MSRNGSSPEQLAQQVSKRGMKIGIDVVNVDSKSIKKQHMIVARKPSQQIDSYSVTQSDLNINSHRMPIVARYTNDSTIKDGT